MGFLVASGSLGASTGQSGDVDSPVVTTITTLTTVTVPLTTSTTTETFTFPETTGTATVTATNSGTTFAFTYTEYTGTTVTTITSFETQTAGTYTYTNTYTSKALTGTVTYTYTFGGNTLTATLYNLSTVNAGGSSTVGSTTETSTGGPAGPASGSSFPWFWIAIPIAAAILVGAYAYLRKGGKPDRCKKLKEAYEDAVARAFRADMMASRYMELKHGSGAPMDPNAPDVVGEQRAANTDLAHARELLARCLGISTEQLREQEAAQWKSYLERN
jgi:hypothetical protein